MKKIFSGKPFKTVVFTLLSILSVVSLISIDNVYHELHDNEFIKNLKTKLQNFQKNFPEDRVYVHVDKPFYRPGETIWFSSYVLNAENMSASVQSDIVHVELINPKGSVDKHLMIIANNGQAAGDFQLNANATGGLYKIQAYTNWQKNDPGKLLFEKTIQVQDIVLPRLKMKLDFERKAFGAGDEVLAKINLQTNENKPLANYSFKYVAELDGEKITEQQAETDKEGVGYFNFKLSKKLNTNDGLLNVMISYEGSTESISRSIPIVLNTISFTLYPEGGDLVATLPTRVAFKALNEFGKPADVEGVILNSKGEVSASFNSYHMGMGAFNFTPEIGEVYTAKITKPAGIDTTWSLPQVLSSGYILNVNKTSDNKIALTIQSSLSGELSLVAQVRGKIYYSGVVTVQKGANKVEIPANSFPIGVAQITLFDSKGIAQAERLVFVNKHKQLNISVSTDKEKYMPREKVIMKLQVKDDLGNPVAANLSLSVVDDQLLAFADDRSGNIMSQLLLEQDLHGKIEEPAFYFDPKEAKSDKALDYLLMTNGWRRFTWKQVLAGQIPAITSPAEQTVISGVIRDGESSKPIEGITVTVGNITVKTNAEGRYTLRNNNPVFPMVVVTKGSGYSRQITQYVYSYNLNTNFTLYSDQYYHKYEQQYKNRHHYSRSKYPAPAYGGAPQKMKKDNAGFNEDREMMDVAGENMPNPAPPVQAQAVQKQEEEMAQEEEVADDLLEVDGIIADERFKIVGNANEKPVAPPATSYYRAREFSAPLYDQEVQPETRSDFRSTIYWNGNLSIDNSGQKTIEFYNSDNITSFRTTIEGISNSGMIGRCENTYFTQLPFVLQTKLPVEVTTEDVLGIPVTLKNNTKKPIGGFIKIEAPKGFELTEAVAEAQTIMPGQAKVFVLKYKIQSNAVTGDLTITFKSCGLSDAFSQKIKVVSKGFPMQASFSGQDLDKEYALTLSSVVNGSLKVNFTAYPNVVNDLLSGIEGILREPGGCFEQTSMSSYPNAMVLDYLKSTNMKNEAVMSKATTLLDKGYNRLITFETTQKGYEWFGSAPGHEALTAYGLLQFSDMQRVGAKVDQKMMERTSAWLISRKDGNGGFLQNQRALDNFGRGGQDITNSYIVYALSSAGYKDISKETDLAYEKAVQSKDPYLLALSANTMFNIGDVKRGEKLLGMLYPMQAADGSWTGTTHSITHSTGQSLTIETTSLVVLAMLQQSSYNVKSVTNAVKFLVQSRSGYGTFGNTQGTVLALKALTAYAKASRATQSGGVIEIYVDKNKVAEHIYAAGEKGNIDLKGLEKYFVNGKNKIRVKFKDTKEALPYSVSITWSTSLPVSSEHCVVKLNTSLANKTTSVGGTNRLSVTLRNTKAEAVPNPIAIIGIPAGFTAQPWQLKELQEKNQVAFYEVIGNNIVLYFRAMSSNEVKEFNFDLKAELPGEYEAPASCSYLYYTNEHKDWKGLGRTVITAN